MSAVAFDRIACTFPPTAANGAPYTAVKDISFEVADGEFVSIVGPTGCGKSTLLNVAAGLLRPTAGRVSVFGAPLAGLNRQAGYLFQIDTLMPWRTALGNVLTGLDFRGVPRAEARAGAAWLTKVGRLRPLSAPAVGRDAQAVALAQVLILSLIV
jgi:NitT/TauT family transport system ATP-binding protein